MELRINLLHISPNFNYSCGVSNHVFQILKHYEKKPGYEIHFITNGGDALDKLKELKRVKMKYLKFSIGLSNLIYSFYFLKSLKKYCKKNKIHIIHTHHRYPELMSILIARKLNIKTVTTAHSLVKGYKYLSFKSDKIITVSNAVQKTLLDYFNVLASKIYTLYNCIVFQRDIYANEIEILREELNLKENDFVILFLGRINKIKGMDILIGAFRRIKGIYPQVNLVLLGNIEDTTIKKLNIKKDENIIFVNAKNNVCEYYKLSDIIVLPSYVDPFPYVMLEAGYMNKPFIGSRTGGIAEFIDDGINGFLFESGNADDLAEKIKYVINNPEKAKFAAEELNKKVKKYCNCEEYFEKLTNIYNELINE